MVTLQEWFDSKEDKIDEEGTLELYEFEEELNSLIENKQLTPGTLTLKGNKEIVSLIINDRNQASEFNNLITNLIIQDCENLDLVLVNWNNNLTSLYIKNCPLLDTINLLKNSHSLNLIIENCPQLKFIEGIVGLRIRRLEISKCLFSPKKINYPGEKKAIKAEKIPVFKSALNFRPKIEQTVY